MEKQVGIVGAGLSGILACKYVLQMGFTPIVFESKTGVGGVWTQTIRTTVLQSNKNSYQFSDFPWPSSVKEAFPDHNQVMEYIESYALHFGLLQYIKFNSRVTAIDYEGGASSEEMVSWDSWGGTGDAFSPKAKWNITVENTHTRSTQLYRINFLILCIGRFSEVPNIPDFPPNKGPEAFDGEVIHSMEYAARGSEIIKGKRVIVVGGLKSALDIANECAAENGVDHPCTMIYRKAHWSFPDYFPWGVPLVRLYFNRFAELMIHKPGEGFVLSLLATLLSPLRWLVSKFVESYIKSKLPLKKYNMVPEHSFSEELASCTLTISPQNFYTKVEQGSIILRKSTAFSFCKKGLMIDAATDPLETDIVILATGYKGDQKLRDIFASSTFHKYIPTSSKITVPLYRECVHPRIPQLAIIGYSESLVSLYVFEMRCRWLAHFLKGTFKMPRLRDMEMDVLRWENFRKQYSGEYYKRSCLSLINIWFNDQLCRDMGCNPRRKRGMFSELFEPYGPMDYANLCPQ